ncbi:MAG: ester cyclase [Proteobacteria bacterium]|nr:ester cyclase [Pseudomonadota bacterium]
MAKSKIQVSEEWFQRVWLEEDAGAIFEMFQPSSSAVGLGSHPHVGPDEFSQFHASLLRLIEKVAVISDLTVEQGDWLSQLVTITGVCRKTGRMVCIHGQIMLKIIDGRIVEARNHLDFISLFEQLGILPKQFFENCLSGKVTT